MKKTAVMLCIICGAFSFVCYGQSWNIQPSNTGFYTGMREDGKSVEIFSQNSLSDECIGKIETSLNITWSITSLTGVKTIVKVESGDIFRFVIYPHSLSYKDFSLLPYLPQGLSFYYDTALFYDITLKVDELTPRITGAFVSPTDLLFNLQQVVDSPTRFMTDTYLFNRIDRLETAVAALIKKGSTRLPLLDETIIIKVEGYYNEDNNITEQEALLRLKKEGIKATLKDVKAVFMIYIDK